MLRKIIYASLVGAAVAVIFCTGHWLGMGYQAELSQSCTIPENKTVTFLEGELSKCFNEEYRTRKTLEACDFQWKRCMESADAQLCEERNLWFQRAHQAARMPVPEEGLLDCQAW